MDRAQQEFDAPQRFQPTRRTDEATFTVTILDVGSQAVRHGVAKQLEEERTALLLAAKLVLGRIRAAKIEIGSPYEFALEAAIRLAEAQ